MENIRCPLGCNSKLLSMNSLLNHLNLCSNKYLLVSDDYIVCKFNYFHIVKSKDIDNHYKYCEEYNLYNNDDDSSDYIEDDITKILFKNGIQNIKSELKSTISADNFKLNLFIENNLDIKNLEIDQNYLINITRNYNNKDLNKYK